MTLTQPLTVQQNLHHLHHEIVLSPPFHECKVMKSTLMYSVQQMWV